MRQYDFSLGNYTKHNHRMNVVQYTDQCTACCCDIHEQENSREFYSAVKCTASILFHFDSTVSMLHLCSILLLSLFLALLLFL